jgi:hypothetical protein
MSVEKEVGRVSGEMTKDELDQMGHGIAFDACCTAIESNCLRVDGIDPVEVEWWNVSEEGVEEYALEHVQECVRYLDARGLLEHHPEHAHYVQLRDETEASAPLC